MSTRDQYDVAVIGGGLAGLAVAIQLAKQSFSVVLFEKEVYPFHKVCGEYISFESWPFLQSLGVPLEEWDLPKITQLKLSSPRGTSLQQLLPLGGFGISRYKLDNALMQLARQCGVVVCDGVTVRDAVLQDDLFHINTGTETFFARACCGAFGKRSNLDVKWDRPFVKERTTSLNHFIAVKYHAYLSLLSNEIALHNFKNGYCGMSAIEDNKACICYLTTAGNLRDSGKSIPGMEESVLMKNPFLKKAFAEASILYEKPLSIAQISFEKKAQVESHILMLGDAAGLITPLCGNGMSMALHSSKLAAMLITLYLKNEVSRTEMEHLYVQRWNKQFKSRLRTGRMIQSVFGSEWLSNMFIQTMKQFPFLADKLIRQTHGTAF